MSIITTVIYCTNCGRQMLFGVDGRYCCPGCDEEYVPYRTVFHGEPCRECDGTGEREFMFQEYHPYSSTYAAETLIDVEECPKCQGKGYHLDPTEKICVVCGKPVGWVKDGVKRGWHVHEECLDESVPRLNEEVWYGPANTGQLGRFLHVPSMTLFLGGGLEDV